MLTGKVIVIAVKLVHVLIFAVVKLFTALLKDNL